MHICTTKSLRAGIDLPPMACPVCGHKTMFASWVSCECDTCGADTGYECLPDYMRIIRERTGLTRKQIAEILGYKSSTVKSYEWTKTSAVYWNKFRLFIKEFYRDLKNK